MTISFTGAGYDGGGVKLDKDGGRVYTNRYKLQATRKPSLDHEGLVRDFLYSQVGVRIGEPYLHDRAAKCTDIDCQIAADARKTSGAGPVWHWTAEATFSSAPGSQKPSQEPDPTKRPAEIEFSTWTKEGQAATRDINNVEITNSALDPIPRPIPWSYVQITITQTILSLPPKYLADAKRSADGLLYSRNLKPFKIKLPPWAQTELNPPRYYVVPPGQGLLKTLSASPTLENDTVYAKLKAMIQVDEEGHVDKFLDEGWTELVESEEADFGWANVAILHAGLRPERPVRLNGQGRELNRFGVFAAPAVIVAPDGRECHEANPPPFNPVSDPVYLSYQYYPLRNWAPIELVTIE